MRAGYARTVELLTAEDRDAADLLEEAAPFALTHLDFPREHRNWMHRTSWTAAACERATIRPDHRRRGKGRRARLDARGGGPSWTSSVRSRKISADDGPGGAYTTFRDTTAAHCQKEFDIVESKSRNRGLVNSTVKTSLCQRNAFGDIVFAHNGTFGTMQVGALPNGVTDHLHQIGIALSGLSDSRQQLNHCLKREILTLGR